MNDSFGARLRRQRERQHITLAQIAASTKIKASLFEELERDDVSRWPGGIFRRSFMRAYAEAIGLDPDVTCREFTEHFPEFDGVGPPSSRRSAGRRAAADATAAPAGQIRAPRLAETTDIPELPVIATLAEFTEVPDPPRVDDSEDSSPRLMLADAGACEPAQAVPNDWAADRRQGQELLEPLADQSRWTALCLDLGVVFLVALLAFLVLGRFWMPLALASLVYHFGAVALLGRTAGSAFVATRRPQPVVQSAAAATSGPRPVTSLERTLEMRDELRPDPVGSPDDIEDPRLSGSYPAAVRRQPVEI
ncbi:MAG: helix-turn-helix domain-containing protein, partial [Vicinamibacterales bacterium]